MPARRRRRTAAWLLVSVIGHGGVLAILVGSVRPERPPPAPIFQIELIRPATPAPLTRARRAPDGPITSAPVHKPTPPPIPAAVGESANTDAPPTAAGPAGEAAFEQAADALAARAACDPSGLRRLNAEERAACEERQGAARAAGRLPSRMEREAEAEPFRAKRRVKFREPGRLHHDALPDPIMVGVTIPTGRPARAIAPIAPSTLRGDDDALRPKPD